MTSAKSPDKAGAVAYRHIPGTANMGDSPKFDAEFDLLPGAINFIDHPDWKTGDQLQSENWRAKEKEDAKLNPKDLVGQKKPPLSVVPALVLMELSLAMMEGARKYGRHNWRDKAVIASIYYDGTQRHLMDWYEGQDIDPDSGLNHIIKAIASLTVLRDAMINEMWVDDRPPKVPDLDAWLERFNRAAVDLVERYPDPKPAITEKEHEPQSN